MFALGVTSIKYQFSIILGHLEFLLKVRKNVNQSNFKINEKKKRLNLGLNDKINIKTDYSGIFLIVC